MVRLTQELIAHSHQYTNTLGDRQLDLRGIFIGFSYLLFFIATQ
jgi:hypothetical protein